MTISSTATAASYALVNQQAQVLTKLDQSPLAYLRENYHLNQANPYLLVYSAFGSNLQPEYPASIAKTKASYQEPLRDFIMLSIKPKDADEQAQLLDSISSFQARCHQPDYLLYPAPNMTDAKRHWYYVVQLNRLLNKAQYLVVLEFVLKELNLSYKVPKLENHTITTPLPLPVYTDSTLSAQVLLSDSGQSLLIDDNFLKTHGVPDTAATAGTPAIQYDDQQLDAAANDLVADSHTTVLLADTDKRRKLFASFAGAIFDQSVTVEFVQETLRKLANQDTAALAQFKAEFTQISADLKQHADKRLQVEPVGTYLHLYKNHANSQNIAQQLLANLDPDFMPDPELKLADAANMITMIYPPAIIEQAGADRDNVVIFNPLTGVWTHDEDLFYSLLTVIRPYSTVHQLDTLMRTFAAKARNTDRYIKPYSGSQYLLFLNGVLDITDMSFHALTEPFVPQAHFIERSQLNLNYEPDPAVPVIPKARQSDGGDWNPKDFIEAYGNNDPVQIQYFLFGLSLGLFGGHNFGVHFDIQGESRWGKTTLSEIYNFLYDNRTVIISFPALNGRFPFTSYPLDTSIIWVKESNIGTEPLDDEHGTVIYDGLADNQVRFEVKGTNDIVLTNPPQVYIDGTQLIQAQEINTGPAGRTLAYKLPKPTTALRNQAYANNIAEQLHNPDVVMWLVYQMIMAYRQTIPETRQADLKLNLSLSADVGLLPKLARDWRMDFASDTGDLSAWFTEEIEPFLNHDPTDPVKQTMMHDQVMYMFYDANYISLNPHDKNRMKIKSYDRFKRQLHQIYNQYGWLMTDCGTVNGRQSKPTKRVSTLSALNFELDDYDASYRRPQALADVANLPDPFKSLRPGWYTLTKTDRQ